LLFEETVAIITTDWAEVARVVQRMGQQANPRNFLLMHAMGLNVAGVIGTTAAAGVFITLLGH